jgi:preprotein translocase subunit SecD
VTAADVAEASLEVDPQTVQPYLSLTFGEAGKEAFGSLTGRLVDRELGIVAEGQLLSRPRVMEAITGGKARISVGYGPGDETLQQLWRIYAAVASGPLPGRCRVVE